MTSRFRYVRADGTEVHVASPGELRQQIRNGDVTEDTLLFDSLTREWAPARVHEAFVDLHEDPEAHPSGEPGEGPSPGGLHVDLAEPRSVDLQRDFVEELSRERDSETGGGTASSDLVVGAFQTSADLAHRPARPSRPPAPPSTGGGSGRSRLFRSAPRARPAAAVRPPRPRLSLTRIAGGVLVGGAVLAVLGLVSAYAAGVRPGPLLAMETESDAADPAGAALTASLPRDEAVSSRLAAAETVAFRNMLVGMDRLRRLYRVERVPRIWLEGVYLARASDYPEVREWWERYREYIAAVEARDTALFRQSYVSRLESQGMSGPMISMRLAGALRNFAATQPRRERVYARMHDLAAASLELHDLLVARQSEISYEPAFQGGVSRDPIVEAVPLNEPLRVEMWSLLDRIFADLEDIHGEGVRSRNDLTDGLIEGVRATTEGL